MAMDHKKNHGITPAQIKKIVSKTPITKKIAEKDAPKQIDGRPVKAKRLLGPWKKPKLLLDVPAATQHHSITYQCPNWFQFTEQADVSVIVPLHKNTLSISKQIESWDLHNDGLKVEIIYVDDCCPEGSRDVVLAKWSERKDIPRPVGKIIYSPECQGFGVSCNIGARHATGECLIFLKPTAVVTPGWVRPLVRQLKKEEVGVVGNMQISKVNGRDVIDSAGLEWNWDTNNFLTIGKELYNGIKLHKPFFMNNCPNDIFESQDREMVSNSCIAIRKSLFEELGGFNPNYRIAHWEDAELCMSAKEAGFRVVYQPNSKIYIEEDQRSHHKFYDHNVSYFMNKWVHSGRIDKIVSHKRQEFSEIKNIVIRRQAAHGDVLVAAAVAPALKKKYPDCKIIFSTICTDVLQNNPYIDRIANDQELSDRQFSLYYNLDMAYEYRPQTNILKAYADVVGVPVEDCQMFIDTQVIDGLPEDYIVIHAGNTGWAGRDWSAMKFDIISTQLQKLGHKVVCVGTLKDHRLNCDLDLRGKTNIAQLAYVIQNAKLLVGIDSFPMHIAQAFNTPSVCFFGSVRPDTRLICKNVTPIVANNLSCLGCHHRQPTPCVVTSHCETQFSDCVNQVSVTHFMTRIHEVLNGSN